jgi:predicted PurR-regulated permease PerM
VAAHSPSNHYGPFLIAGTVVLVVAALYLARTVLIPLALATLLAFILAPAVIWLQRHGLKRVLAVTVVVLVAFALLGIFFWEIAQQVSGLGQEMAANSERITKKIKDLQGDQEGVVGNFLKVFRDVGKEMERATRKPGEDGERAAPTPVVVQKSDIADSLGWFPILAAPLAEVLASVFLVIMLVVFMLVRREDLRDRLFGLIGHGRVTMTTRALDEATQRISRYLATLLAINTGFGTVFALVLFFLGVPYAFLWGFLTGVLRFVPYVGTWLSLLLPLTISVAIADTWTQPLLMVAIFTALELATANIVEPLLFSHSTGISQIALLVAAAFWTWLWGPLGLVLSTPLSVCLVVLAKYVPQLAFFDVLMGDEPVLTPPVMFYQRLLARDQDEAAEVVEEQLQQNNFEGIYDRLLLPALVIARDVQERNLLPPDEQAQVSQGMQEILDTILEPQQRIHRIAADGVAKVHGLEPVRPGAVVFGCPARDEVDELALKMLQQLLEPAGCRIEVFSSKTLAAEIMGQVTEQDPALVCIGSVGPGGLAQTRYLCKRLKSQFPDLKTLVGRWSQGDHVDQVRERLLAAGAYQVVTSLLALRDLIVPLLPVAAAAVAANKEKLHLAEAR